MDDAVARALVLDAPRRLVVREFRVPTVGDDDALLRVSACGLCGTDHEQYTGELASGFAFVPGHETVGTIEAIGSKAAKRWVSLLAIESLSRCSSPVVTVPHAGPGSTGTASGTGWPICTASSRPTASQDCGVATPNTST
ncbi:alcohol dehydrogenase GroES-like domain protein [Mycobacterium xenopi 4042]|uniref:Alcohol dehydrogenase GroES-like domain protein n=1 Tax=Mycobacterium xenopi 4042 TaxID=1299334 RepID=X8DJW7_MYCXE|nr:alcohol dehydrogenase GroES-like domain protein [Mycobacterium xenopi 4042]